MKQVIVGVGNEFRSDDTVGLLVARNLKKLLPNVDIYENDGDVTNLLSIFQKSDKVIIIDAAIGNSTHSLGEIKEIILTEETNFLDFEILSSHSFNLLQVLRLGKQLAILPKKIYLYLIFSKNFSFGTELSEEVKKSAEKILDIIIQTHFSYISEK